MLTRETAVDGRPQAVLALSPMQYKVTTCATRHRLIVTGRRTGKTVLEVAECNVDALSAPNRLAWYVAPTYRMARDIAWELLLAMTPPEFILRTNETRLEVQYINRSIVALKGADNPDSLRGRGLTFAALDEYSMLHKDLWPRVIRPMLAVSRGRALFGCTPMGFNHAYDLYSAIKAGRLADFAAFSYTTLEGGFVDADEIEAARRDLDPRIFRQEFEASFEALAGRVYTSFDRKTHASDETLHDLGAEILIGMDFNVNPMSCVIAQLVGDQLHVLDALELPTSNTEEMAAELRSRYEGRVVIVCPDPSGKARKTSASAGTTDFTLLEDVGFEIDAPNVAPLVKDRVNAVNSLFRLNRCYIHPRAEKLVRALEGLTYKDGTNLPDKTGGLDHICDALGYLIWQQNNPLEARWQQSHVSF